MRVEGKVALISGAATGIEGELMACRRSSHNARTSTWYSGGERGQCTNVQPDGFNFVVGHQSESMPGHEIWVQELALWSHPGSQCVDEVGLGPTPQCTSRCKG